MAEVIRTISLSTFMTPRKYREIADEDLKERLEAVLDLKSEILNMYVANITSRLDALGERELAADLLNAERIFDDPRLDKCNHAGKEEVNDPAGRYWCEECNAFRN